MKNIKMPTEKSFGYTISSLLSIIVLYRYYNYHGHDNDHWDLTPVRVSTTVEAMDIIQGFLSLVFFQFPREEEFSQSSSPDWEGELRRP